jgi:hypothetical protein
MKLSVVRTGDSWAEISCIRIHTLWITDSLPPARYVRSDSPLRKKVRDKSTSGIQARQALSSTDRGLVRTQRRDGMGPNADCDRRGLSFPCWGMCEDTRRPRPHCSAKARGECERPQVVGAAIDLCARWPATHDFVVNRRVGTQAFAS